MNEAKSFEDEGDELKAQVTLVRYNETANYNMNRLLIGTGIAGSRIKAIYGVYMYDRTSRTHCCEITPSYWMEWLRHDVEWNDEPTETEREAIDEALMEANVEDSSHYRYCRVVERFITEHPKDVYIDKNEYESMDEAREHHNGNHVL